jgi:ribosomal protein S27AE
MNLTCERCQKPFDNATWRGYCDDCLVFFQSVRDRVNKAQHPEPNVCADGKFAPESDCPHSFYNPVADRQACGLCGSTEIEQGYGLGSGHGMGVYMWCNDCEHFLDFSEDRGE